MKINECMDENLQICKEIYSDNINFEMNQNEIQFEYFSSVISSTLQIGSFKNLFSYIFCVEISTNF